MSHCEGCMRSCAYENNKWTWLKFLATGLSHCTARVIFCDPQVGGTPTYIMDALSIDFTVLFHFCGRDGAVQPFKLIWPYGPPALGPEAHCPRLTPAAWGMKGVGSDKLRGEGSLPSAPHLHMRGSVCWCYDIRRRLATRNARRFPCGFCHDGNPLMDGRSVLIDRSVYTGVPAVSGGAENKMDQHDGVIDAALIFKI